MTNDFWGESPNPNWKLGDGSSNDEWKKHKKISINPSDQSRDGLKNYKMICGAVTPRPIGFISTIKANGVNNLAPFSYFNVVAADPPLFTVSFSGSSNKDTLEALLLNKELTINIISEWMIEAANLTAIVAGPEIDEWELSGLTPVPSEVVKPPHVAESGFSIEAKLIDVKTYDSKFKPGTRSSTICIVEGVNFHVREDLIDQDLIMVDTGKLKPVGRLGGNCYSTITAGYELPRFNYENLDKEELERIRKE
ncbi:hypothetical protein CLIB1444_02S13058 [[Candida] jaroonii]|uniref:Uncharacterized protein n=1 Tax=[Candida] jaroonii TaxID=467808 RepID=A0ACA9Y3U5_9ASCO|nr:hypothetical protein CLIB1444_02S13058 [[Candida] jaroonii]